MNASPWSSFPFVIFLMKERAEACSYEHKEKLSVQGSKKKVQIQNLIGDFQSILTFKAWFDSPRLKAIRCNNPDLAVLLSGR